MNRRLTVQDAGGGVATTVYDQAGNVVNTIDQLGNKATFTYDAVNRRTKTTDARGGVVTTVYDGDGNAVNAIDAVGDKSTMVYDSANRLTQQVDPLGRTTTVIYDTANRVTSRTDPLGRAHAYTYDADGRVLTETWKDAGGATVDTLTYTYDAAGNRLTVAHATSLVTTTYDALNRPVAQTDPLNHTTTTVYDAVGNVIRTLDALNNATTMGYDAANRRVTVQDPAGGTATTAYDAAGNVVNRTDPLGQITTLAYDRLNRPTQSTDPRGGVTTTVYDRDGNVVNVVDPDGNQTTFVYDAANNLVQQTDPLGHGGTFAYDLAGRRTSATDRLGRRRDSAYDADGRLTSETWKDAGGATVDTLTYTYDAAGNELTAANGAGAYTLTYDALNRPATQQEPFGLSLTFSYDALGNRSLVQDSLGGTTTSVYDAASRLTSRQFGGSGQTPLRLDVGYTSRNQVASETRYSDLAGTQKVGSSAFTYDAAARLTNLQHKGPTDNVLANYTYTYDLARRLTSETLNGTTTSYGYDAADQLTSDGSNSYSYDLNGNRTMTGYTTGAANQLTGDGTWTYSYDAEGNLTKKTKGAGAETWYYGYNHRDQMTSAKQEATDGGTLLMQATYTYDAFGNRLEKDAWTQASGTTTTRFAYDGSDVWADLSASNALQTRYLHGDEVDQLFARISAAGAAAWYLTDRLGSVRDLTDASGAVQDHVSYDSFGNVVAETNPSFGDRYKWTDREADAETGLQYSRARYYDNKTGGWTSQDPLGLRGSGPNLYRYVSNAPTAFTDPSGLLARIADNGTAVVAPPAPAAVTWLVSGGSPSSADGGFYMPPGSYNPPPALTPAPPWAFGQGPNPFEPQYVPDWGLVLLGPQEMGYGAVWNTICIAGAAAGVPPGLEPLYGPTPSQIGGPSTKYSPPKGLPEVQEPQLLLPKPKYLWPKFSPDPTQPPGPDWQWKGQGPVGTSQGSWVNATTGESLHPDLQHEPPMPPHYDYTDPFGKVFRLMPDGSLQPK